MTSLRGRLFVLLAATTVFVWSAAAVWIYVHTRDEVQRVLDRRLVEAASMVASLAQSSNALAAVGQSRVVPLRRYDRQLSCQIWTLSGQLVGRSNGAPDEPLARSGTGMSERLINGETWRVFTITDPERGLRISVGDNLKVRQGLISDLMTGLLIPALAGLLALAVLIWAAVRTGLAPLRAIAAQLRHRDPADFSPLKLARPAAELVPLAEAIDSRSERLNQTREAERHFIASAAHELQTPLAGLRTHAQIALRSPDGGVRRHSLESIEASVERTSLLVRQLLDLAREEGASLPVSATWIDLRHVAEMIEEEFRHSLKSRGVRWLIGEEVKCTRVLAGESELMLALKNLAGNAIEHSPSGGRVSVRVERGNGELGISIDDEGPGISREDLQRVRGRFIRGASASGPGSGLGLSIVEIVAARLGGRLELANREGGGLRATLWLPHPSEAPLS